MTEVRRSSLIILKGHDNTPYIMLDKEKHVLGKLPYADTGFESIYVSRRHAEVLEEEGLYKVRDLDSENGTSVNGKKVVEQGQTLNHNDMIELAEGEVILRFDTSVKTVSLRVGKISIKKGLVVDYKARKVYVDDQLVSASLTTRQVDILNYLYTRKGEACSKDQISKVGWPDSKGDVSDENIQQAIHLIREAVEPSPSTPQYIITITGYGYRLDTPVLPAPKT